MARNHSVSIDVSPVYKGTLISIDASVKSVDVKIEHTLTPIGFLLAYYSSRFTESIDGWVPGGIENSADDLALQYDAFLDVSGEFMELTDAKTGWLKGTFAVDQANDGGISHLAGSTGWTEWAPEGGLAGDYVVFSYKMYLDDASTWGADDVRTSLRMLDMSFNSELTPETVQRVSSSSFDPSLINSAGGVVITSDYTSRDGVTIAWSRANDQPLAGAIFYVKDIEVKLYRPTVTASVGNNINVDTSVSSVDVSLDVSSRSSDVKVRFVLDPLVYPILDLNASTFTDGDASWIDSNGLAFAAAGVTATDLPTKTPDGFITVGYYEGWFSRTVVQVEEALNYDLDNYTKDSFIPYDSSFTVCFTWRWNADTNYVDLYRKKLFGYSGFWSEANGGGWSCGTHYFPQTLEDGTRVPGGFSFAQYGDGQNTSAPPASATALNNSDSGVQIQPTELDYNIGSDGVPDGTIYKMQYRYDHEWEYNGVRTGRGTIFVNGVEGPGFLGAVAPWVKRGVGLSGLDQIFYIGRSMQGGWGSATYDIKTLRSFNFALSDADIARNWAKI